MAKKESIGASQFGTSGTDHGTDENSDNIDETKENTNQSGTSGTSRGTDELCARIINLIQENNQISTDAMIDQLKISKRTLYRMLKVLKEKGTLERKGTTRSGYWVVNS